MKDCGPRTEDPGLRTVRIITSKERTEEWRLAAGNQGQWTKASLGWPRTCISWIIHNYIKVYEILPVAEMAQCTLSRGFFLRVLGFPSLLTLTRLATHCCESIEVKNSLITRGKHFFLQWNTNLLLSAYFLVTCAHFVLKSPLQLLF